MTVKLCSNKILLYLAGVSSNTGWTVYSNPFNGPLSELERYNLWPHVARRHISISQLHTVKNSSITTKHLYLVLTFRSHHEISIRRSWYSVLPSLDVMISCRIKKAVVGVTQPITALTSIHSSMTFLADMYNFLDPPGRTVLFSATVIVTSFSLWHSRDVDMPTGLAAPVLIMTSFSLWCHSLLSWPRPPLWTNIRYGYLPFSMWR